MPGSATDPAVLASRLAPRVSAVLKATIGQELRAAAFGMNMENGCHCQCHCEGGGHSQTHSQSGNGAVVLPVERLERLVSPSVGFR